MSRRNRPLSVAALASAAMLGGNAAVAQDNDGWSGEAAFIAGYTTGNTETTDLGFGIDVAREHGVWTYEFVADGEYGEQDGVESRNRYFLSADVDRQRDDKLFAFGRTSYEYEADQFTGFDSRTFVGGGLGYHICDSEQTKWTVPAGPGVKIDEVGRIITTESLGAALIIPAETVSSFGAVARSAFGHKLNDNVKFTNATDVVYGETSTQIENRVALTASVSSAISARMSFNVGYDTHPADGFEDTDTALKVARVHGFGK